MSHITDTDVLIQSSSSKVSRPSLWFGEVVLLISYLRQHGVLSKISEQVRFARRRFGRYMEFLFAKPPVSPHGTSWLVFLAGPPFCLASSLSPPGSACSRGPNAWV